MSWHRSKRIAKHSLKWLNWTLLLPALFLVLVIVILLYTTSGLHLTLWLAQKSVPGLQIEHSEGSVLGGTRLRGIYYQQDTIELSVEQAAQDIPLDFAAYNDIQVSAKNGCYPSALSLVAQSPVEAIKTSYCNSAYQITNGWKMSGAGLQHGRTKAHPLSQSACNWNSSKKLNRN